MTETLAFCRRVVSAVAENLGSPMALRAMITALGQELGACVGLIYGLKRDGRFHLVESFGLDRQTVKALEGLDPRDFISPADVSAGLVSVRSDLKPLLEAPPRLGGSAGQTKLSFLHPCHSLWTPRWVPSGGFFSGPTR
jgi:GAF domain-containing protein